jgi:hypothetical protein
VTGSAAELAAAELAEETGVRAATWGHLGRMCPAYGMSSQWCDVWLATDLEEGETSREVTEQDMVHRFVTDAELEALVRAGDLVDGGSLAALALYRIHGAAAPR